MTQAENLILSLRQKGLETLLIEMAEIRERSNKGENVSVPLLTVSLSGGTSFVGWLISFGNPIQGKGKDKDIPVLLLHVPGSDLKNPKDDLVYIPLSFIQAILTHGALEYNEVLQPVPTVLDIKRCLEACAASLKKLTGSNIKCDVNWSNINDNDDMLRNLLVFINATQFTFERMTADAKIIGQEVKTVYWDTDTKFSSSLSKGTLNLSAPLHDKEMKSQMNLPNMIDSAF